MTDSPDQAQVTVPFDDLPMLPASGLRHAWQVHPPGDQMGTLNRLTGPVVAADAPPANDNDIPARPNTGTAFVTRFRFEACFTRGMVASSVPCKNVLTPAR